LLPKEQEFRGIRDKAVFTIDATNEEFRNIDESKARNGLRGHGLCGLQ